MFKYDGISTIGGQSRPSNAPQFWSYKTTDQKSDILEDKYFNPLIGKLYRGDLIFCYRQDENEQNREEFVVRVLEAPYVGDVKVELSAITSNWEIDLVNNKISPIVDNIEVHTGLGGLFVDDLDPSAIVNTDSEKQLISIPINTAYNRNFESLNPEPDSDSGNSGSLNTIPRGDHSHPKVLASTTVIGQVELATIAETQSGIDNTKAITPSALSGRTATTTRTGIAEIATQAETDDGTDDERIVTPKKLNDRAASEILSGIVRLATDQETKDGTLNNVAIHPVGLLYTLNNLTKIAVSGSPAGTPDANTLYKENIPKAWINFNGVGTVSIRDSFNVSSLIDGATGTYTINWDRDFADSNYCFVSNCHTLNDATITLNVTVVSVTPSYIQIGSVDSVNDVAIDVPYFMIAAFGSQ